MAQKRKVIKSIEEATCETCIYSMDEGKELQCNKHVPMMSVLNDRPVAVFRDYWCGVGEWLTRQGEHVWVEKLMNLHRLFNIEEDCNHCFTGEGCGGFPKKCVTNETT
jgi:hypothetical protein